MLRYWYTKHFDGTVTACCLKAKPCSWHRIVAFIGKRPPVIGH